MLWLPWQLPLLSGVISIKGQSKRQLRLLNGAICKVECVSLHVTVATTGIVLSLDWNLSQLQEVSLGTHSCSENLHFFMEYATLSPSKLCCLRWIHLGWSRLLMGLDLSVPVNPYLRQAGTAVALRLHFSLHFLWIYLSGTVAREQWDMGVFTLDQHSNNVLTILSNEL